MLPQTNEPFSSDENEYLEQLLIERMMHISSELTHDLRSPLQSIQNAVYLLQKNPENEMFYDIIRQSLKQATDLLDDFRDYYKAHITKPINIEAYKIVDLALSGIDIPPTISLKKEYDKQVKVNVDSSKIALAIQKLINNSITAMGSSGQITLEVSLSGKNVEIRILDTGSGIPEHVKEYLYLPFHSDKKLGHGLGVPTAYRITVSNGGELHYRTSEGQGTIFVLEFPVSPVDY